MSTLKINTLQAVAGGATVPIADVINGTARAWVNFNGTGTVAIRASYNVAGITDNGVGDYTANFTTAMADTGYSAYGVCGNVSAIEHYLSGYNGAAPTASAFRFRTCTDVGGLVDVAYVSVGVHR